MIEPVMYFGIGFLVAALLGLIIIPLIHGRAVRLTMRRLEATTPLSMAEILADKDQLRAEFAMSTRRLEKSIEQLKTQKSSQLAELGKKADAINRLKIEISEKTAAIFALEARDKALRDQLLATEEEVAAKSAAVGDVELMLSNKHAELANMTAEFNRQLALAEAQRAEIVALKAQIDAVKERLIGAGHELKAAEDRREAGRVQLQEALREIDEERSKVESLIRRVAERDQKIAAQTAEAQMLGRRAQDLEAGLSERSRQLTQTEVELKHAHAELETARKAETDLRSLLAELDRRERSATTKLKDEKAELQTELERTKVERDRLSRDLAELKRETEEAWASERMENSLLRERINDVAAEVARLASALEGPNSPIDAILASEGARDLADDNAVTAAGTNIEMAGALTGQGTLTDRIRALRDASNERGSKRRN